MTEQELQKQQDHEKDLERLRSFRPIDDTFMRMLFRDNLPLTEYVLRIITGIDDLHLIKSETQKDLIRLAGARGISLDIYGEDDQDRQYDLEVQRADRGANAKRARYHASALDVETLSTSQDFENLPAVYIIFITENDIWRSGKALYPVDRINTGTGAPFPDRQHIVYANAHYDGDDPLGRLMHDFLCSDPENMLTPLLAEKTRYYKEDPKGVAIMCKVMEDLREESIQRGFKQGITQGVTQGIDQSRIESIHNIMDGLKYTAKQAMDLLKIPTAEQERYMAKL